jgi:hypothetical protein
LAYEDLAPDLLELVLVRESFELRAEGDQAGILLLEVPLLLHDARDLLRHHFGHLVAHVRLQHVQEGQLLQTL